MKILLRQRDGLGNQLFQYAAGLYFARKYGASLEIIPDPEQAMGSYGHARPFMLAKFRLAAPVRERTPLDRLLCAESPRIAPVAGAARRLLRARSYSQDVSEIWSFRPELPVAPSTARVYVKGFFQAWQFSQKMEPEARAQFQFREAPAGMNLEMLDRIRAAECPVSLHVRRGDYMVHRGGQFVLPVTYQRNAMRAIAGRVSNPTFFVFSDDIGFARESLPSDRPMIFVSHNDALTAHEDLRLMSACRHHIVANSTFSWWGAWLNPNPAKLVFAPDPWLDLGPNVPNGDLVPPAWIRIQP